MKTSDFEALYPILDWTYPAWGEIDISATITYTTPGQYGPIQHTYGSVTYHTRADLLRAICNAADVLATPGTGHIVVDAETRLAYQISGYSPRHGAFSMVCSARKASAISEHLTTGSAQNLPTRDGSAQFLRPCTAPRKMLK